jgi:hypothetical protein
MELIGSKRGHLSTRLVKLSCDLSDFSPYTLSLLMGAECTSETSFSTNKAAWCQNEGNHSLNSDCHENLLRGSAHQRGLPK